MRLPVLGAVRAARPRLAFRQCARPVLADELGPERADRVWRETLRQQRELAALRRRHSPGTDLLLRYMEWSTALYRALRADGLSEGDAGALIERINWAALGPTVGLVFAASRARGAALGTRVRWLQDLLFRVLYTRPFQRRVLPGPATKVDFDVTACPLAAYMRTHGAPELTPYAACNLDHTMARAWGVELTRTQTIAGGASHCDFRFHAPG